MPPKTPPFLKDFFGVEIKKGDTVIYASKGSKGVALLMMGEIQGVYPGKVRLRGYLREHGDRMVVVDMQEDAE